MGYEGVFKKRSGKKEDGCAIFYKHDRFSRLAYSDIAYNELFHTADKLDGDEFNRDNVGQILALKEEASQRGFIVTNTHLYWNYRYNYPRLLQALMLLTKIVDFNTSFKFPVILCGDWNITPDSAVYRVLTGGTLADVDISQFDFPANMSANVNPAEDVPVENPVYHTDFNQRRQEYIRNELFEKILKLPYLESTHKDYCMLAKCAPPCPGSNEAPYTNITEGWEGTLDFIFTLKTRGSEEAFTLLPTKIMELPPHDLLVCHKGLPDDRFSSDHVCLMCQFSLS